MKDDTAILEILLELAEDEVKDLKDELILQYNYIRFLEIRNNELTQEYNNLLNPDSRLN